MNRKWYGDGTELPTDEGKLYLASVLDVGSHRVPGFAIGEHHDTELAYAALAMAVAVRGGDVAGVILHTDSETVRAGVLRVPDSHTDGRDRMLVPGAPRAFLTLTPIDDRCLSSDLSVP